MNYLVLFLLGISIVAFLIAYPWIGVILAIMGILFYARLKRQINAAKKDFEMQTNMFDEQYETSENVNNLDVIDVEYTESDV